MKQKKIPMRRCTGCGEQKPKKELVRVVKTPDGSIVFDKTGKVNGRGAYVCLNIDCFRKAVKSNALQRALECQIPSEAIEAIEREIGGNDAG